MATALLRLEIPPAGYIDSPDQRFEGISRKLPVKLNQMANGYISPSYDSEITPLGGFTFENVSLKCCTI